MILELWKIIDGIGAEGYMRGYIKDVDLPEDCVGKISDKYEIRKKRIVLPVTGSLYINHLYPAIIALKAVGNIPIAYAIIREYGISFKLTEDQIEQIYHDITRQTQ